jgi:negative regulator of replication initiation
MQRTQIYLDDNLHHTLITRAKQQGISMSELIRRLLKTQLSSKEEQSLTAENFFEKLQPLESFAEQNPEQWVRELRSKSRILR